MEYNGENDLLAHYDHSGLRTDDVQGVNITSAGVDAGLASSAGSYRYLKDALGSITEIVDANANLIQQYEYSAYGKILKISDGAGADISSHPVVKTSYTFTGREHDDESGLYYYRARYYDPGTGRFLQKDPHPGKLQSPQTVLNSYTYVINNPGMYTDPSGQFLFLAALIPIFSFIGAAAETIVISAIVGGLISGTARGLMSMHQGQGFFSGFGAGFVSGLSSGAAFGALSFGLGALGVALKLSATITQVGSGLIMGSIGATGGAKYGLAGGLLGFFSGFIGGVLGSGAGYNAYGELSKDLGGAGAATSAYEAPVEPVVPTQDEFDTPAKPIRLP